MSEDGNRLPDIDALIQARDTQEARMNEIINVAEAENVVAVARADDLVGAFRAGMRRYKTTRRQAADAQRNGSPDEIAEASKLERQAYADTLNIAAKASAESRAILATAEGSLQEVNEQVESVLGARKALDNALAPATVPVSQALLTAAEEATTAVRAIATAGPTLPDEITTAADELAGIIPIAQRLGMDMLLTRGARSFLYIIQAPCWTPDIQDRLDELAPAWTALAHALKTSPPEASNP